VKFAYSGGVRRRSSFGSANGTGVEANFNRPYGVAVDGTGYVYVADSSNHCIRKISPEGVVTTLAGDGNFGYADGTGTAARFDYPYDVADSTGYVYVADTYNHRIRRTSSGGVVTTLAGNTNSGYADGSGTEARFNSPDGVAVDSAGYVYVADYGNGCIRKISPEGVVATLARSGAGGPGVAIFSPWDVAVDSAGYVYVADIFNHCIRKISPEGVVTTLAGSGAGYADGTGAAARFNNPYGVAVNSAGTVVYVADYNNHRIRTITRQ
jgi:sugar lactone lactonase YvrE